MGKLRLQRSWGVRYWTYSPTLNNLNAEQKSVRSVFKDKDKRQPRTVILRDGGQGGKPENCHGDCRPQGGKETQAKPAGVSTVRTPRQDWGGGGGKKGVETAAQRRHSGDLHRGPSSESPTEDRLAHACERTAQWWKKHHRRSRQDTLPPKVTQGWKKPGFPAAAVENLCDTGPWIIIQAGTLQRWGGNKQP